MLDNTTVRQIAKDYATVVADVLAPKKVILFGSYTNGTAHEWSDIDIAVVFDTFQGNWYETAVLLGKLRESVSIDIEPHLLDESSDQSGFLEYIIRTGEPVYEAA